MAQTAAKYILAVLLALLSSQAVVPSASLATQNEIVWCAEAQQQKRVERRAIVPPVELPLATRAYTSRRQTQRLDTFHFQRPPPSPSVQA